MTKYYVYYGYVINNEELEKVGATHKIKEFKQIEELKEFHKDFLKETDGLDCYQLEFRIFEGEEKKFVPVEKIIEYELE